MRTERRQWGCQSHYCTLVRCGWSSRGPGHSALRPGNVPTSVTGPSCAGSSGGKEILSQNFIRGPWKVFSERRPFHGHPHFYTDPKK